MIAKVRGEVFGRGSLIGRTRSALAAIPIALIAAAPASSGRVEALRHRDNDQFGHSIANVGDLNGDGRDDLAVCARLATDASGAAVGAIFVFSGATGSLLWDSDGVAGHTEDGNGEITGTMVSGCGDISGDRVPDVLVGTQGAGRANCPSMSGTIKALSGKDGRLLFTLQGNDYHDYLRDGFAAVGDTDRDGVRDIAITSRLTAEKAGRLDASAPCVVRLLSGKSRHLLMEVTGSVSTTNFGRRISDLGDLNGDGKPELAVAAVSAGSGAGKFFGQVNAISGADGKVLWTSKSETDLGCFGDAVDSIGDVNGDGVPDLVIGAPQETVQGMERAGQVSVLSGKDGTPLYRRGGTSPVSQMGTSVALLGDVNGDRVPDFVVGGDGLIVRDGKSTPHGRVWIISGVDGAIVKEVSETGDGHFGQALAGLGDVDGDSLPDFAVGVPVDLAPGRVVICSGKDGKTLRVVTRPKN